ncbi:hypothetical protein Scep_015431 [Stephania cephalantha]|uniref:Uncharacterized protein n=1 Tax=Stephania cephalantha TaxID=152367 RepID=A0AAP0J4K9_9MAGN
MQRLANTRSGAARRRLWQRGRQCAAAHDNMRQRCRAGKAVGSSGEGERIVERGRERATAGEDRSASGGVRRRRWSASPAATRQRWWRDVSGAGSGAVARCRYNRSPGLRLP